MKKCEETIRLLTQNGSYKALISEYRSSQGPIFHLQEQRESALGHYEKSLTAYDELAINIPNEQIRSRSNWLSYTQKMPRTNGRLGKCLSEGEQCHQDEREFRCVSFLSGTAMIQNQALMKKSHEPTVGLIHLMDCGKILLIQV